MKFIKTTGNDREAQDGGNLWEVLETISGRWLVLKNGYKWGPDQSKFDHGLGCSEQTWDTSGEAASAVKRDRLITA